MELSNKTPNKTLRYKLKQSEFNAFCEACVEGKTPIEVGKESDMGWAVGAGAVLVFAIIWVVYIKWIMRGHINKLVKRAIIDGHITGVVKDTVNKEVQQLVYYSYADLKNGRVRITVEDKRTDSLNTNQGEYNGIDS